MRLTISVDSEACLAWLEDALAYAYAHSRPKLWAYLEAVMEDVLFEMELEARLQEQHKRSAADRRWPQQRQPKVRRVKSLPT